MTSLRLHFAGQIKKCEHKEVGGKKLVEVSLCRKNRVKPGEPEAFTWVRAAIWEPADFQVPKLNKGAFIAGSGEMTLRSFMGKDGKQSSLEVRCTSFDVEVADGSAPASAPAQAQAHASTAFAPVTDENEPPW